MLTTKTKNGQTWLDMTLQTLGDEGRIFELCDLNGVGITDDLAAGTEIETLEPETDKVSIVTLLKDRVPCSLQFGAGDPAPEGIEYWTIESDFVVS